MFVRYVRIRIPFQETPSLVITSEVGDKLLALVYPAPSHCQCIPSNVNSGAWFPWSSRLSGTYWALNKFAGGSTKTLAD